MGIQKLQRKKCFIFIFSLLTITVTNTAFTVKKIFFTLLVPFTFQHCSYNTELLLFFLNLGFYLLTTVESEAVNRGCSVKKVFLKISQKPQGKTFFYIISPVAASVK